MKSISTPIPHKPNVNKYRTPLPVFPIIKWWTPKNPTTQHAINNPQSISLDAGAVFEDASFITVVTSFIFSLTTGKEA